MCISLSSKSYSKVPEAVVISRIFCSEIIISPSMLLIYHPEVDFPHFWFGFVLKCCNISYVVILIYLFYLITCILFSLHPSV